MAFRFERGHVVRNVKAVSATIETENGRTKKVSIPAGTRLKAMSKVDKDHLKCKIKDENLPDSLQGEHVVLNFSAVGRVARGRPSLGDED